MIEITSEIFLDDGELNWDFVRSSGPGGQKVNKVATAVQLRFDVSNSDSIPDDVKQRLVKIGGKRVTDEGTLIINARSHRSQIRNREDALDRLIALIREAAEAPTPRRATKPSKAANRRRLEEKKRQSAKKRLRKKPTLDD